MMNYAVEHVDERQRPTKSELKMLNNSYEEWHIH